MDEDLIRGYSRWREADQLARDEEADAAFKTVFAALPAREPSAAFARRTMEAVAVAASVEAGRSHRMRVAGIAGGSIGGALALYFGASLAFSAVTRGVVWLLDVLVAVVVRSATAMENGADLWTVVASLGRAAAVFVADPKVTFTMVAIQGIAVAALFALQRLLGSDGESFK